MLARLDGEEFRARLDLSKSQERAARAEYRRAQELYENNALTKQELELARRNFEVTRAETRLAAKALEDTVLRAPFDGSIARKMAENHQSVDAKKPVLLLQDLESDGFDIEIDVPERDVAGLDRSVSLAQQTERLRPEVYLPGMSEKPIAARFKTFAALADPTTRTLEMTLGFDPPQSINVLPGMTATVRFQGRYSGEEGQRLLIPMAALVDGAGGKGQAKVWKVEESPLRVTAQAVSVGEIAGSSVEVLEGLQAGVQIATSGVQFLREGMRVREFDSSAY